MYVLIKAWVASMAITMGGESTSGKNILGFFVKTKQKNH
jgi:hypothetical protein